MDIFRSSLVAMAATLFCIWLLAPLAHHIGFVDRPGGRKHHENDTPLIGGVAMFFGFCFSLLALGQSLHDYRSLLAGVSLLILIGVVDDFKELKPKLRLIGQLVAALFLTAWGGKQLLSLGNLFFFGDIHLGSWALPVTIFCVMAYLNAMNMLDGQDGLAGGIGLSQTILMLFVSLTLHRHVDTCMLTIVAVLLIVFLAFNMRTPWRGKASIFMGDSGVTFIAFLLCWFAIDLSQANSIQVKPITLLWILAFPLFDLVAVSAHRFFEGKSLLSASRDHFHHVLHVAGVDVQLSTFLLIILSLSYGIFGIVMNVIGLAESWQFISFLIALFAYLSLVRFVREPLKKAKFSDEPVR